MPPSTSIVGTALDSFDMRSDATGSASLSQQRRIWLARKQRPRVGRAHERVEHLLWVAWSIAQLGDFAEFQLAALDVDERMAQRVRIQPVRSLQLEQRDVGGSLGVLWGHVRVDGPAVAASVRSTGR